MSSGWSPLSPTPTPAVDDACADVYCGGEGHGVCQRGRCFCHPGWTSADCTYPVGCPRNCTGHGRCDGCVCRRRVRLPLSRSEVPQREARLLLGGGGALEQQRHQRLERARRDDGALVGGVLDDEVAQDARRRVLHGVNASNAIVGNGFNLANPTVQASSLTQPDLRSSQRNSFHQVGGL